MTKTKNAGPELEQSPSGVESQGAQASRFRAWPPPSTRGAREPDSPGPQARGGAPGSHLALQAAHTRHPPFISPPRGSGRCFPNCPGDARVRALGFRGVRGGQVRPLPGEATPREARPPRRFASSRSVPPSAGLLRKDTTSALTSASVQQTNAYGVRCPRFAPSHALRESADYQKARM